MWIVTDLALVVVVVVVVALLRLQVDDVRHYLSQSMMLLRASKIQKIFKHVIIPLMFYKGLFGLGSDRCFI